MWCAALIRQNLKGFMRLFIFLQRWKQVCCCCCSASVLTVGWTHGTNAVVQRSLALILASVRRHSCFSSLAAILVNLQQNSLLLQSEMWKPTHWLRPAHRHTGVALITSDPHDTFQLLHVLSPPFCFYFLLQQWNCARRDQGQLLPTSWLLSCSKVPL